MRSEYCINCCGENTFNSVRPEFCQHCGDPFNKTVSTAKSSNGETKRKIRKASDYRSKVQDRDTYDGNFDDGFISDISESNVTVSGFDGGIDIKDIIGTSPPSEQPIQPRPTPKSLAGVSNILEYTRRECESSLNRSKEVGGGR